MNTKSTNFPLDCISDFIFVENEIHEADIILVPGCEDSDIILKAVELYKNKFSPKILISGKYNTKIPDYNSEADYLSKVAIAAGVNYEDIIMEEKAANTFENARYSLEVINKKQLNLNSAIIVCRGFHSRRALLTYSKYFGQNINLMCATVSGNMNITKFNWMYDEAKSNLVMGEVIKIGMYFKKEIKYYINDKSPYN